MVVQGLLIALVVYLAGMSDVWLAQPMLDRPLVIGTLVGLILGDLRTGVMCGAQLELVFIGVAQIGNSNPPDAMSGTAIGTAFVILNHQNIETAIALAIPVATLIIMVKTLLNPIRILINPLAMKLIEKDEDRKFKWFLVLNSTIMMLPRAIIVFIALMAVGTNTIESVIAMIPTTFMDGLSVGGGMIAAVGVAMLLRNMWTGKSAVYYILGFLMVTYFGFGLLPVAIFGIVLAMILFFETNKEEPKKVQKGGLFDD
ncbi:PTS mannose/fructose/sorbose/N-acetylgalactosamine transporter subunit IIC [Holdemania massiliensis]|uniref:PTS mannose/fructose/sorbose/N-acetylgalactosamine transporter subunit IIC n=1 Tax=Holdemania massiliensis TaxID=1468449 RepID=UPI001F063C44|nr:PTS sugar transporter subunit IIC [Holdemania massiliensis]MCH1941938.1 PTS sugar transporter subunit IIC [Holdemania massiliensis]